MLLIEAVLGNAADAQWAARLSGATVEALELDHWEAQKNRFRKKTAAGTELAVSLDRGTFMRDGDILLWDEQGRRAVVARISLRDVMVVQFFRRNLIAEFQPDAVEKINLRRSEPGGVGAEVEGLFLALRSANQEGQLRPGFGQGFPC